MTSETGADKFDVVLNEPKTVIPQEEPDQTALVAKIFADVFDRDAVAPDDNFFHLGGDSLMAAKLMATIEREFGPSLSIAALLETPTPRSLGEAIFDAAIKRSGDALLVVQEDGNGPPIFCVHGMRGVTWFPQMLVDGTGGTRPIYGFRAIGLQAGERPHQTVEQIASNYITALRRVRDAGPYILLGECGGSLVALEIAQRLIAQGEIVLGLILVDPLAQHGVAPYLSRSGLSLTLLQSAWADRARKVQSYVDNHPDMTRDRRNQVVRDAMFAAVGSYAPGRYPGKTLLLYTTAQKGALLDEARGFPTFVPDCEVSEIIWPHEEMSLHKPELVERIVPFLDRVAPLT